MVFFQLMTVLRASPRVAVFTFLVMRFEGSRKASSIRGFVVPSWMGLKKNGSDLYIGITFFIKMFSCASPPVLDIMPSSFSFTCDPSFTSTEDVICVYPERRHFTYTCPRHRSSTLQASRWVNRSLWNSRNLGYPMSILDH